MHLVGKGLTPRLGMRDGGSRSRAPAPGEKKYKSNRFINARE